MLLGVGVVVLAVLVARGAHACPRPSAGGLVLGGGLGQPERAGRRGHHGQVADFITLSHWPTFNVADACITVGVIVVARPPLRPAVRHCRWHRDETATAHVTR